MISKSKLHSTTIKKSLYQRWPCQPQIHTEHPRKASWGVTFYLHVPRRVVHAAQAAWQGFLRHVHNGVQVRLQNVDPRVIFQHHSHGLKIMEKHTA